jgi:hypothetical protein
VEELLAKAQGSTADLVRDLAGSLIFPISR